jgi:hypothetical protein
MRSFKKLFVIWVGFVIGASILFVTLPHTTVVSTVGLVIDGLMFLIGIVSFYVFLKEPNPKNKPIFLNFSIFFLASLVLFLNNFTGKAFWTREPYATFYAYQYFSSGVFFFLLAFAIVYVVFDSLFNDFKTYRKYILTFLVVGGTFAYYYHPVFESPRYLYSTENIVDLKVVSNVVDQLKNSGNEKPTVQEIAAVADLGAWKDGVQVGTLFEGEKLRRVAELLPYTEGSNFIALLYRPLYFNIIYMNVLCVIFIFLFFGYQYKNDPPQGAYIEKIVFLFLPYSSLEILHHYGYIKSVEYSALLDIQYIGQYLTLLNLVFLLTFFSLRLRFITTVKGEFYERELVSDSEHISRWRDAFDNLIVRHFLNPQTLHGRLFAPRTAGAETDIAAKNHS